MPVGNWGYNARAASKDYAAIEFAQTTVSWPITDKQCRTAAWFIKNYMANVPRFWPSHAEVEHWGWTGQIDGKTDAYPVGDPRMDDLRNRVANFL